MYQNNRDKQIEEMVKHCHFYEDGICKLCEELWVDCDAKCDMCEFAKQLYNAGYRKASEVAREIFEEIENTLDQTLQVYNMMAVNTFDFIEQARARSTRNALQTICDYLTELKKKYTEER